METRSGLSLCIFIAFSMMSICTTCIWAFRKYDLCQSRSFDPFDTLVWASYLSKILIMLCFMCNLLPLCFQSFTLFTVTRGKNLVETLPQKKRITERFPTISGSSDRMLLAWQIVLKWLFELSWGEICSWGGGGFETGDSQATFIYIFRIVKSFFLSNEELNEIETSRKFNFWTAKT